MQKKLLTRSFQILLLAITCIIFIVCQTGIFQVEIGTAVMMLVIMLLCGLGIGGVLYVIINWKRISKDLPPYLSFMSTYRFFCIVFLLYLSSQGPSKGSSSNSSSSYSSTKTYHCTWCGKEYTGSGYMHVVNECVHPQEDIGMDICCSSKCCWESWNKGR